LEDGLRKLADGAFWQYIPNLDWSLVQKHMGTSRLFSHLVEDAAEEGVSQTAASGRTMAEVIIELLDLDPSDFDADVPFTGYGLDSLSAARLSLALRPYFAISQLQLLSDVSLNDIQRRIDQTPEAEPEVKEDNSKATASEASPADARLAEMEAMIEKYTRVFPIHSPSSGTSPISGEVVLVTGTTGAIGAAMLAHLATMETVSKIYAFNRKVNDTSITLYARQTSSLRERGYDPTILQREDIVLVEGDQTKYNLGISPGLYEEVSCL